MTTRDVTDDTVHPEAAPSMPPKNRVWSLHRRALVAVATLILPIAWIDRTYLGPSPGAWISLDLRGILIGAFVIYFAIHTIVTSSFVAMRSVQHEDPEHVRARVLSIHALTLIAFSFAAVLAFVVVG